MADQDNPMPMEMGDAPASEAMNSSQKGISPYLIMQAQHELSQGNLDGEGMKQLGAIANQTGAIPPEQAAFHAERAGRLPAGTTQSILKQKMGASSPQQSPSPQTAANPAGAMGSSEGDPQTVNPMASPSLTQIAQKMALPATGQKGTSASAKVSNMTKDQTNTTSKNAYSQDDIERIMGNEQGIRYPEKVGPDGKGTYDLTQGVANPNNPYQQNQSNLQKLQDLLNQRRAQGPVQRPADLGGFAMASDFLNHTDTFGKDYGAQRDRMNKNIDAQEKQNQDLYGDQNSIVKDQNDMNKNLITAANTALQGGTTAKIQEQMNNILTQQGYNNVDKGQQLKLMNAYMTQSQKVLAPIMKDQDEIDKIGHLALSHNPADMQALQDSITRLMTNARPAVQLIESQGQDPGYLTRMNQTASRILTGNNPAENQQQIMQLISDLNKATQARKAGAMDRIHGFGKSIQLPQEDQDRMTPDSYLNPSPEIGKQLGVEGAKSLGVQQGKAAYQAASQPILMYKAGMPPRMISPEKRQEALSRGYSVEKQ